MTEVQAHIETDRLCHGDGVEQLQVPISGEVKQFYDRSETSLFRSSQWRFPEWAIKRILILRKK
jgi:hypothetical protein